MPAHKGFQRHCCTAALCTQASSLSWFCGSRNTRWTLPQQPQWRCAKHGQRLVHRHSNSRRHMQLLQCKAVDLQDGVLPQQQSDNSRLPGTGQEDVILPPTSNMQAQVMLVPKKNASTALLRQKPAAEDPMGKFLLKCKLAWNLFFPPQHDDSHPAAAIPKLSPKDLGKQRLQMILVADRCGLSPNSLVEMKKNTLAALADCMDLEDLQDAHLRFTMTREGGTTYSMAVPILRPGPYTEDGSVAEQGAKRGAAGIDAMVAAAAAAGAAAGWEADEEGGQFEDEFEYGYDEHAAGYVDELLEAPMMDAIHSDLGTQMSNEMSAAELQQQPPSKAAGVVAAASGDSDSDFKEQLRELLVEELVHDVEELQHTSAEVGSSSTAAAATAVSGANEQDTAGPGQIRGSSSSSGSPVMGLSEQELREVATQEVQRLVGVDEKAQQQ